MFSWTNNTARVVVLSGLEAMFCVLVVFVRERDCCVCQMGVLACPNTHTDPDGVLVLYYGKDGYPCIARGFRGNAIHILS